VFVIMAEDAQVLPITAVGRVVIMVAVFVVNGQQVEIGEFELAGTLSANPAVQLEGTLAVVARGLGLGTHAPDGSVDFSLTFGWLWPFIAGTKGGHSLFLLVLKSPQGNVENHHHRKTEESPDRRQIGVLL